MAKSALAKPVKIPHWQITPQLVHDDLRDQMGFFLRLGYRGDCAVCREGKASDFDEVGHETSDAIGPMPYKITMRGPTHPAIGSGRMPEVGRSSNDPLEL